MMYSEYSDAIEEGDGIRVMQYWKFLMLNIKAAKRRNYACEVFNFLAREIHTFTKIVSTINLVSICKHSRWNGKEYTIRFAYGTLISDIKGWHQGTRRKQNRAITKLGKCIDSIDQMLNNYYERQCPFNFRSSHNSITWELLRKNYQNKYIHSHIQTEGIARKLR